MLQIDTCIDEHKLLDYVLEDDQIKRINEWLLIKLLKFTLQATKYHCSAELYYQIMDTIKLYYADMKYERLNRLLEGK